jgi:hypothetical protein
MFYDFSHDPDMVTYHSPLFWKRVTDAWKMKEENGKNMFKLIFGKEYEEVRKFTEGDGLHLLASGYSWKFKISWYMSLFEYKYTSGEGYKSNMHNVTERKVTQNMENFEDYIDVSYDYTADEPYLENSSFFGDDKPRYIIRHATGKELAGSQPDVFSSLGTQNNGITDIYTYNGSYGKKIGRDYKVETEEDIKTKASALPMIGYYLGADGFFYPTKDCKGGFTYAVAIVVYCGGSYRVESDTEYNGLAMALENTVDKKGNNYILSTKSENVTKFSTNDPLVAAKDFNGYDHTMMMYFQGNNKYHPAVDAVFDNHGLASNLSSWFIPSAGQWCLAMEGLGLGKYGVIGQNEQGEDIYGFQGGELNINLFYTLGLANRQTFFTSTEYKDKDNFDYVWGFDLENNIRESNLSSRIEKKSSACLRKFIAFKYSSGGKKDIE